MGEKRHKSAASLFAYSTARHLADLLLPIGFGLGDFIHVAKSAFVDIAAEHIRTSGHRVSTSRIAIVTGLSRAEVARVRARGNLRKLRTSEQRAERVMHGWFTDPRFLDSTGAPVALPHTGRPSLGELVKTYSGDVPRQAVLKELLKGGMVKLLEDDLVAPMRRHYATTASEIVDFNSLISDLEVLFRGNTAGNNNHETSVRRMSVHFPQSIPAGVRRNISLRTERFLDALSEYVHSSSTTHPDHEPSERVGCTLSIVIAAAERSEVA